MAFPPELMYHPFYMAKPDSPFNVTSAFISGFLQTRLPWVSEVFSTRLAALNPDKRRAHIASLVAAKNDLLDRYADLEAKGGARQSEALRAAVQLALGEKSVKIAELNAAAQNFATTKGFEADIAKLTKLSGGGGDLIVAAGNDLLASAAEFDLAGVDRSANARAIEGMRAKITRIVEEVDRLPQGGVQREQFILELKNKVQPGPGRQETIDYIDRVLPSVGTPTVTSGGGGVSDDRSFTERAAEDPITGQLFEAGGVDPKPRREGGSPRRGFRRPPASDLATETPPTDDEIAEQIQFSTPAGATSTPTPTPTPTPTAMEALAERLGVSLPPRQETAAQGRLLQQIDHLDGLIQAAKAETADEAFGLLGGFNDPLPGLGRERRQRPPRRRRREPSTETSESFRETSESFRQTPAQTEIEESAASFRAPSGGGFEQVRQLPPPPPARREPVTPPAAEEPPPAAEEPPPPPSREQSMLERGREFKRGLPEGAKDAFDAAKEAEDAPLLRGAARVAGDVAGRVRDRAEEMLERATMKVAPATSDEPTDREARQIKFAPKPEGLPAPSGTRVTTTKSDKQRSEDRDTEAAANIKFADVGDLPAPSGTRVTTHKSQAQVDQERAERPAKASQAAAKKVRRGMAMDATRELLEGDVDRLAPAISRPGATPAPEDLTDAEIIKRAKEEEEERARRMLER